MKENSFDTKVANSPFSPIALACFDWAWRRRLPEDIELIPMTEGLLDGEKSCFLEIRTNVPLEDGWDKEHSAFLEAQAYFANFFEGTILKKRDTFFFSEPEMTVRPEGDIIVMAIRWFEAPKTDVNKKMMERWLKREDEHGS